MRKDKLTHPSARRTIRATRVAFAIGVLSISPWMTQATSLVRDMPFDRFVISDESETAPEYRSSLPTEGLTATGSPEIATEGRRGARAFADLQKRIAGGDFKALAEEARALLASQPDAGLAYEIIGTAHFLAARYDDAQAAFETALSVESGQSGPWSKLGIVHLQKGDIAAAKQALRTAVEINPADRDAHQRLGMLYEQAGDADQAIRHYTRGLQGAEPGYLGVAVNLATLLNNQRLYAEALRALAPRLPLSVRLPDAQHVLGTAYLGTGDYVQAQRRFERALEIKPDYHPALLGLSMAARGNSDYDRALAVVDQILAKYPKWPAAHTERGQVLLGMGQHDQAISAFQRAQSLGASRTLIAKLLTVAYVKHGKPAQAEAMLYDLVRSDDADAEIYSRLSELRLARGDAGGGERALNDGIEKFPSSAFLRFRLGSYLAALRRYPDAIGEFERALTLAPNDPTVLQSLSLAQARSGDFAGSVNTAGQLYEQNRFNRDYALLYATRLQAAGRNQQAIDVYRAILTSTPDDALTLNNVAYLLAEQEQFKDAIRYATRAAELAASNGRVLDTLGWVRYRQGRHETALEIFERAIRLAPDAASIRYHKGLALAAMGRKQDAGKAMREALSMAPNADWAGDAEAVLHKGR